MPTPVTLRKAKQGRHGFASALRSGVVVDPGMCVSSLYLGNREISCLAGRPRRRAGPCREGEEPEPVEPRAGTKGNAEQGGTLRTLNRAGVFHGLDRERRAANTATPLDTQGKNRMPELGTYGSVRGALSNGRLYRDP